MLLNLKKKNLLKNPKHKKKPNLKTIDSKQ